jgi:GNAT superfamily N-acetyltransferase
MPADIVIRPAIADDVETLLRFEQAIIEYERPMERNMKSEPFHYYDLSELIQLDTAQVLVAEHQEKLIGSGFIHIRKSRDYLDHDKHGYLGFMYTDPNYRGQGINNLLIRELTKWAIDKGLKVLALTVFAENESAIKAYQKAGFYSNLVEMRLNLDEK